MLKKEHIKKEKKKGGGGKTFATSSRCYRESSSPTLFLWSHFTF